MRALFLALAAILLCSVGIGNCDEALLQTCDPPSAAPSLDLSLDHRLLLLAPGHLQRKAMTLLPAHYLHPSPNVSAAIAYPSANYQQGSANCDLFD